MRRGTTLVELLVSVGIMAACLAFVVAAVPWMMGVLDRARTGEVLDGLDLLTESVHEEYHGKGIEAGHVVDARANSDGERLVAMAERYEAGRKVIAAMPYTADPDSDGLIEPVDVWGNPLRYRDGWQSAGSDGEWDTSDDLGA